jgi:hypothetical protein
VRPEKPGQRFQDGWIIVQYRNDGFSGAHSSSMALLVSKVIPENLVGAPG